MPDDGCRQSERHPFGVLRVDGPRVAFFGEPFLRVFVRAAFLIDSLDFALAEERFFGALRAFFAREAFFFVTAPPVPAGALDGAADLPRALQSTFFCDCRLAGSGIPAAGLLQRTRAKEVSLSRHGIQ